MEPKITILMSVYNGEKYLREAIDSILNQTYKDFEFLIINDGSTDRTPKILQSYKDQRIKIINNEKNIGLTKSLNKGLKIAKGEYIARMDADDISMAERLEKQVNFLDQKKNIGLVGTSHLKINEKGKILQPVRTLTDEKELKEKLLVANKFYHGSVMFRKVCIDKVGFYREEFKSSQDYDLWLRIADYFEMRNIPEILYKWRVNIKSISVAKLGQQAKYGSLAIKLAKERKQFGKDRIQLFEEKGNKKNILNDLPLENDFKNRVEIAQGHNFWGKILLDGKDYKGALKLLLKSFINNPLNKDTWRLILKDLMFLLFPKPLINILRFLKSSLL